MISAKIIADSICSRGHRLTTLEVVMPRYILAEFNTHRVLSKNSASSRAIPVKKMIKSVQENLFTPYAWQKEHIGMQGTEYITDNYIIKQLINNHLQASKEAINRVEIETELGATKQNANRKLEPFMYHKVLVSATEWENFFNLRCPQYKIQQGIYKSRKDALKYALSNGELKKYTTLDWLIVNEGQADIHMMFLAEAIYDAMNESTPKELKEGEWHIPYGDNMTNLELSKILSPTKYGYEISNQEEKGGWTIEGGEDAYYRDIEQLKCKISIARCARLSYQTLGDNPEINYEKDLKLYEVLSKSGHWSPFEHVARVMTENEYQTYLRVEVAKKDEIKNNYSQGWCRNFRGFIQQRALID
jgi:thymidylate synthase ThyX